MTAKAFIEGVVAAKDPKYEAPFACYARIYDCSGMSSGPSNQKTTYYQ
jgi:hypothetical protein